MKFKRHDLICEDCIKWTDCVSPCTVPLNEWGVFWKKEFPELMHHYRNGCVVCNSHNVNKPMDCYCNIKIREK